MKNCPVDEKRLIITTRSVVHTKLTLLACDAHRSLANFVIESMAMAFTVGFGWLVVVAAEVDSADASSTFLVFPPLPFFDLGPMMINDNPLGYNTQETLWKSEEQNQTHREKNNGPGQIEKI